jgi:dimethylhistidine N-methyltransferase
VIERRLHAVVSLAQPAPGDDVLGGLRAPCKRLPCRLLYDARGAELFERICRLPEYYPTRSELALLAAHLPAFARVLGPRVRVIEPGSGAGRKTRALLSALDRPEGYVPIDVAGAQLEANTRALRVQYPDLEVQPVHGDFTRPLALPPPRGPAQRALVFFPGSTIGNFEPDEARAFLARFRALAGPGAALLLGADSNHEVASLLRAYDDPAGVTAAFDLNVLANLNRTYGATFELDRFMHRAVWDQRCSRIEMHLVSRTRQTIVVAGERFHFERGEPIVTEHCYKYVPEVMHAVLASTGWHTCQVLADPLGRMRLWFADESPGKLAR